LTDAVKILVTIFAAVAFASIVLAAIFEFQEVQMLARGSQKFDGSARRRIAIRPSI
jgi:hypothetical protein